LGTRKGDADEMRRVLVILAFLVPLAFAQTQTFTYTYTGLPLPIYPDDWNVISIASIDVPRSIVVGKVTVGVQVQYNGIGDLNLYLYSPIGTRTKLLERDCGSLQNIDTTFDDAAPNKFADYCPAEAGRGPFRGDEPLSNSVGQNGFGRWRLAVENNGSGNTGSLSGFSITITGTGAGPTGPSIGPNTIVSLSSFMNGSMAPGDYVAILGSNLGPNPGVRADATQTLPTTLGQTQVNFDGNAAPMFYASQNFIAVHAPFTLNPGATTQITVVTPSGTSVAVPLTVVPAKPGVLTYQVGGQGQAKAINQDGSINGDPSLITTEKPAPAGSTIAVYATGLGAVNPAIVAGTPPPTDPLSTTVSPVTATIGGQDATVLWAGAAPTLTGIYQVNITVPATARSGANRLVLTSAGNSSQADVTIQVK
jgi:uncharacterized protein (TIGR03437 family)